MPLTRTQILRAFERLADELESERESIELVIAGGAAIVLLYDSRASTRDVDACHLTETVREAAGRVAASEGLPAKWIDDDMGQFVPDPQPGEELFRRGNLTVRAVRLEQFLALKLCASRDSVDFGDARRLIVAIEASDPSLRDDKARIWLMVERYLVPLKQRLALDTFEDLWEDLHAVQ